MEKDDREMWHLICYFSNQKSNKFRCAIQKEPSYNCYL